MPDDSQIAPTDRRLHGHVRAALDWYRAMGVDVVVQDASADWFDLSSNPRRFTPAAKAPVSPPAASINTRRQSEVAPAQARLSTPSEAAVDAKKMAATATDLATLRAALENFEGCRLKVTATNLCFSRGADQARLMVIGEAPGADEDRAGVPFVGRAGQLLDRMLAAINLDDTHVHITNTVYWRPPGNRTPTPEETQICWPFLERQIAFVDPDFLMLLGGSASKTILSTTSGIMKTRGRWQTLTLAGRERHIMPTLHPAYLLRTPAAKRLAWRDLLQLSERLS